MSVVLLVLYNNKIKKSISEGVHCARVLLQILVYNDIFIVILCFPKNRDGNLSYFFEQRAKSFEIIIIVCCVVVGVNPP